MNYKEVAEQWLNGNFDAQTKEEVKRLMDEDPTALEDAFYRKLEFGTGGLRGLMGVGTNRMNKYTVGMASQGLVNYILENVKGRDLSVCISYDSRNNSKSFAKITADVCAANGIKVYLFDDIRPTPELSYAIRKTASIAGVMITASHNPKEYNGYKVFWEDGAQITSPVDTAIVEQVNLVSDPDMVKFDPGANVNLIELIGQKMDEAYLSDILSLCLSPEARLKHQDLRIVYTPLHGCGVRLLPEALRRLGFKNVFTVAEQCISDGNFPTVKSPNPEEPSALKMALDLAEEQKAQVVMASDPDADRLGIAIRDDKGKMLLLNGNQTASLICYYMLNRWKELGKLDSSKYIVKTIVTSELLREIAESFGIKCYNVLTGFKYIAEVVREHEKSGEFICGGEESFGFNAGQYVRDKDSIITASLVMETMSWAAEQGLSMYQLLQKIYKEFGYRKEGLVSLVRQGKKGAEEIQEIMSKLRNEPPKTLLGLSVTKVIDYLDVAKTGLPKSNVLQFFTEEGDVVSVRPSGTEPKIKFYFGACGADADAKIERLKAEFV